jgi:hypothetical protein
MLAAVVSVSAPGAAANDRSSDVIIEWNELLQQNIVGPPFAQVRIYATMHVAMADAVVSVRGGFAPFHVRIAGPRGASAEAAAAQAARDVLVALIPAQQATFDAALEARLMTIPRGVRGLGVDVGAAVAAAVLAWRQSDGFTNANPQPPDFLASTLPGIWRQTASGPAQFSKLGAVQSFGLVTPTQYLPGPPPQLESDVYARDYDEVKNKGRATGSTRTLEEERAAQLFAGAPGPYANVTNFWRLWNNIARDAAEDDLLPLVETARLFALLTVSMHDSLQTAHTSKFVYRLWRPETAIDQADLDNNAGTTSEAGWPPLLSTPPYPSHSSNAACLSWGAARMVASVLGADARSFTATWYTGSSPPAIVHSQVYDSFSDLADDASESRIWGGIHFRFELDASKQSCTQVADYIYANYMQPDG